MDTGTKTYQIDKHKQLIPLNGSTVNFSCFFEVKSKDKKPFNITIVEQGEIKPKQYKLVDDGYINGQIESDGQLKSYFLVLKAQQPCECDVRVVVKPKEVNEVQNGPSPQPPQSSPVQPPIQPNGPPPNMTPPSHAHHPNMVIQKEESYFQMKYILGISIALIIVYLLYRYRKTIFGNFSNDNTTLMPSISNTSF
jgi:hypothetical protein